MKTLHGLHINQNVDHFYDLIDKMQPSIILLLHPKVENIEMIRVLSPQTTIVGRAYFPDGDYASNICNDPYEFADRAHEWLLEQDWVYFVDFVQTHNEVCQESHYWNGAAPTQIERKAEFDIRWMSLASTDGYYKCAVDASSVGQPSKIEDDGGLALQTRERVASYAGQYGHLLVIHEYGWPDFWSPDNNYVGRYFNHFYSNFTDEYAKKALVAAGEFGVDRLIEGTKGGYHSTGRSVGAFAEDLHNYHYNFNHWRSQGMNFIGAAYFCLCNDDWGDYDAREPFYLYSESYLPEYIEPVNAPTPPEPPTPEPPEETVFERRFANSWHDGNLQGKLIPAERLLEVDPSTKVYWVKDFFTTVNGSWEPNEPAEPGMENFRIPQWALEYQTPWQDPDCFFDDAGGDHHIFFGIRIADDKCKMMHNKELPQDQQPEFVTWSGGGEDWPNWEPTDDMLGRSWVKPHSGWGNVVMYGGPYYPWDGQVGPYAISKGGGGYHLSERVIGMGMPANRHVSWFFVYGETTAAEYYDHFYGGDITPPTPDPEPCPDCPECPPCPECPESNTNCLHLALISLAAIRALADNNDKLIGVINDLIKLLDSVLDDESIPKTPFLS